MFKVGNGKAVRRLALRSFAAARTRNVIAILAIIMTTTLFTVLFTAAMGTMDSFQRQTVRMSGGDGHGILKYMSVEQYEAVKDHPLIKEISFNRIVADSVDNPELGQRYSEMVYLDASARRLGFVEPTTGRAPQAANELITDTQTLDSLGIPREPGAAVSLQMTVKGKKVQRDFILSGFWETDPALNVGFLIVSEAYTQQYADELAYSYRTDMQTAGTVNSYIMFHNEWKLRDKLDRVMDDSGLERSDSEAPGYVDSNVNWAYLSNSLLSDPVSLIAVSFCGILIAFTGYLIIYNIFQISVIRDVRFYGLLKTVGTTGRQIRRMVTLQTLLLSAAGIPAGLITGYFGGMLLVPYITRIAGADSGITVESPASPLLFAGSALFALLTVFSGVRRPGRMAASVSPVEAERFTEGGTARVRKEKRRPASLLDKRLTDDGSPSPSGSRSRLSRMARANIGRSKRRMLITLTSLSLSLVLLNTVFTLSRSFDMDKYVSAFTDSDYLIGHVNYFRYAFSFPEHEASPDFIQAVQERSEHKEGGRIYHDITGTVTVDYDPSLLGPYVNLAANGQPWADLYGLEDFPLSRMELIEGEGDPLKLKEMLMSGDYIVESVQLDDYGTPLMETSHYAVGEDVVIVRNGEQHTFKLAAKIKQRMFTLSNRRVNSFGLYLPADVYLKLVDDPVTMSYVFNVEQGGEKSMEQFVQDYVTHTDRNMNYTSKAKVAAEFNGVRDMVLLAGGALSLFVGLIGLLNYVNSVITGIASRRREFATMQAIGMTGAQLRRMLTMEGLYYAAGTLGLSLLLASLFSLTALRAIGGVMWFMTYRFTLWPLLAAYVPLLITAVLLPGLVYGKPSASSVVERLRMND